MRRFRFLLRLLLALKRQSLRRVLRRQPQRPVRQRHQHRLRCSLDDYNREIYNSEFTKLLFTLLFWLIALRVSLFALGEEWYLTELQIISYCCFTVPILLMGLEIARPNKLPYFYSADADEYCARTEFYDMRKWELGQNHLMADRFLYRRTMLRRWQWATYAAALGFSLLTAILWN